MILTGMCILACLIFTLIFVGGTIFHKEVFFREYSPQVQKRYLELHPDFKIPQEKITPGLLAGKGIACLFFTGILTGMAWVSGADSFLKGFCYSYLTGRS